MKVKLLKLINKLDKSFSVWSGDFQAGDLVSFCFSLCCFGMLSIFL